MSTPAITFNTSATARKKITTLTLRQKKERGEPISMLTAYDYPSALAVDQAGVDVILVGDSLARLSCSLETSVSRMRQTVWMLSSFQRTCIKLPMATNRIPITAKVNRMSRFMRWEMLLLIDPAPLS